MRNQRTSILVECWFPRTDAGRSRPLTRRAARLHRLVRTSPPACGRLHSCADNVPSRLIVTVPVHPATTFNGFLAHECPAGNLVAARLDGATGRSAPRERQKVCVRNEPGRTEPILAPRQPRHGLARARPDSPALRPLHSATRTALQATRTFRCIPTVANCRDRRERRALPRWKFRERGQLSFRCATRNSPPSLQKRQWADTSFIRLRAVLRCAPLFPLPHFARRSAGWPRSQRKPRSRWRDSPDEPRPRKFNIGSADGWHEGCEPGSHTRAVICKAAPMPYPAGA